MIRIALIIGFLLKQALQGDSEAWKKRTIYQILTDRFYPTNYPEPHPKNPCPNLRHYCGGTFKGIQDNLDYIKGMGFDAIWISPIVKNPEWFGETQGYHGYWMTDLYALNHHFGTSQDLKNLVKAAHDKDIWVMVDIVANHFAPLQGEYNFSSFSPPLNKREYFHEFCDSYGGSQPPSQTRLERCWLFSLADLNHEHPFVYNTLVKWIGNMTNYFDLDGIRIDTVIYVPRKFWKDFAQSSGVYQVGEALDPRIEYVASYQDDLEGR